MLSFLGTKTFDHYKKHVLLFLTFITVLVLIGLFERSLFAIFHKHLLSSFNLFDVIYTLLWGLKFDIALAGFFALIYVLTAYTLQRTFNIFVTTTFKYLLYIFSSIIFLLQGGDIIYFSDASRHLGYEVTDSFNDAPELIATAWSLYKTPLLIHLALYPVLIYSVFKISHKLKPHISTFTGFKKLHLEAVYFLLLIFSLLLARGGFQSIPIEPLHAQEISDSSKASLALNGAYNVIFHLFNKDLIKPIKIKLPVDLDITATLKKMYGNDKPINTATEKWLPNIIFIFLESWPAMYMQSYGYDKSSTPFFDELRKKSLTSLEMIAGGHRTTEGLYTSLCSAQNPLGQSIAQSQLQEYKYYCLPHKLRDMGYKTSFFQGSNKNTSGTGAFAQSLGFTESYGKADIKNRIYEENYWGVYDQDLYNHVFKSLKLSSTPQLIGINTNTTHDVTLPKGIKPQFPKSKSLPRLLNALYFSDQALKEFFDKVENDKDIKDTLWVIVADHTAGLKTSRLNNYRVPFLIYNKNKIQPNMVDRVASQRDIPPTILDIMNINQLENFTGKTLLDSDNPPYFSDYYHSGIIGWIENDLLIETPTLSLSALTCYDFRNDKEQKVKVSCPSNSNNLRNNALSFTFQSQKSLFNGHSTKKLDKLLMKKE